MGAGLLTCAITDLEAMADANSGQRASAISKAGIEVSKARLAEAPDLGSWSSGALRMEGTDEGSVVVTIERRDTGRSVATSTGEYGGARRRIEATFSFADGEPRLLAWREVHEQGEFADAPYSPLRVLLFPLERVLDQRVGVEGVGFHEGGAAVGALDLILLRVHRLQGHLVLGENPSAHAAHHPALAHAALLSLA